MPIDAHLLPLGSAGAHTALGAADVVVCATSARTPLFDSTLLRPDVIVIAVGSHESGARELDSALLARISVVVEDTRLDERFEIQTRADNALEVFYHPYAYAPVWISCAAALAA